MLNYGAEVRGNKNAVDKNLKFWCNPIETTVNESSFSFDSTNS